MPSIEVNHNVEMGHRLSLQPDSKCFHLHGHSWRVYLTIYGPMNAHTGMIMDFGEVKKKFREFLDTNYDHHLLLNPTDPLITFMGDNDPHYRGLLNNWGVTVTDGRDPTVENFASIIYEWAKKTWTDDWFKFNVKVYEAATNCASYGDFELSGYQGQEPREAR